MNSDEYRWSYQSLLLGIGIVFAMQSFAQAKTF
jgi:hypothetical protein